ncbi:ROK family protein [Ideonella sp. BN130291]|uniref:ROK family protein n=1 Tax=Ideonella sp. BN130291 TaxID=3112940 RepID=UPI002E2744D2|nr:ROK family protein [Ideonella sp. BN130291]
MGPVIALDVGGTHSRAALFEQGRITWRASQPTPGQMGPQAMVDTLVALLQPLHPLQVPVGVAVAGQVLPGGAVTAHNADILRDWSAFPLAERLQQRLGREVQVFNDARAAAWAEYRFGAGQGCSEFLFVTVSTGVGAGLVLGGRLHLAGNGMDAELGETLAPDGQTLEAHASGTGLGAIARQHGWADAKALCDAADAGDVRAEQLLRHGIRLLAHKLADLSVMLGIQRTALGGGLGLRPGYLPRLRQEFHRLPALYQHEIIPATLGADAGLYGAAALAWQQPHGPHSN